MIKAPDAVSFTGELIGVPNTRRRGLVQIANALSEQELEAMAWRAKTQRPALSERSSNDAIVTWGLNMKPDAVIRVRFKKTEENGRNSAVEGAFYACPLFVDGQAFDCRLLLDGRRLELGSYYEVPVKFLFRDLVLSKLVVGKEVVLWEGKDVANGSIVSLGE